MASNRGSLNSEKASVITHVLEEEPKSADYIHMPNSIYYSISITIYVLVVIASITLPNIGIVFGIVGSTAVSLIVFLAPGGYLLRSAQIKNAPLTVLERVGAWAWVFWGFLIMFSGNFVVIYTSI